MKKYLFIALVIFGQNFTYAKSSGIKNMTKATEGIYRGGRPLSVGEVSALSFFGIKTIVNLQGGDRNSVIWPLMYWNEPGENPEMIAHEKNIAKSEGMDFFNAPLNSLGDVTKDEDHIINQILDFMHEPSLQPVYVHCEHGVDRTGMIIALYKVKFEGMDPSEAHKEWSKLGHKGIGKIFTHELDEYFYEKVKEFKKIDSQTAFNN
jgi:protein tyrosine/serine phosphatase